MTRQEFQHLSAERATVQSLLDETPPDDVLDRGSLEDRLREIDEQARSFDPRVRDPLTARLTYRGRPVVASRGVFAEFGVAATRAFTDAVTMMAASFAGPLAPSGPIPNRGQNQLLIIGTAVGSFGFELQEHAEQLMFGEETAVSQAMRATQDLLAATIGSDDELTDAAAGIDPRVLAAARSFLETLASNDAVCALQIGAKPFRFTDVGQVRSAIQRLGQDNLHEANESFTGSFQGVLPKRRTFEFRVPVDQSIIAGRVGTGVQDAAVINQHLGETVGVTLVATRVGRGRPKYVLQQLPNWPGKA